MSENNNGTEFTTSQINQSEAGPDTVQLEQNLGYSLKAKNKENENDSEKIMRQPVNVVAPLKVEGRGATQAMLEVELGKLQDLLKKQEKMTQQRVADSEEELAMRVNQLCSLKEKIKESEERERCFQKKLVEQEESKAQLSMVMQEYEMLIGKLTAEVEANKKLPEKVNDLTSEKEAALLHLSNVEAAFSDVHSKYEKCKKVVEECKRNEVTLKNSISELQETVRIKEKTLESLQTHAGSQLEAAQRELDRLHRDHEQELTRLTAMLRKTEIKVISLQESLDQKVKENQELTTICDDLIAGRGAYRHN